MPGNTVLDVFAGTGLGAHDALTHGCQWVGIELEQPFNDIGSGCDCTGISKTDWVRFYGRWQRMRYAEERYWCPQCPGTSWASARRTESYEAYLLHEATARAL